MIARRGPQHRTKAQAISDDASCRETASALNHNRSVRGIIVADIAAGFFPGKSGTVNRGAATSGSPLKTNVNARNMAHIAEESAHPRSKTLQEILAVPIPPVAAWRHALAGRVIEWLSLADQPTCDRRS
jgi:hypothetical protein